MGVIAKLNSQTFFDLQDLLLVVTPKEGAHPLSAMPPTLPPSHTLLGVIEIIGAGVDVVGHYVAYRLTPEGRWKRYETN